MDTNKEQAPTEEFNPYGKVFKTQDPKYVIINNQICNASTKKPIPDDEPIMIFRAQDELAEQALLYYLTLVVTHEHKQAIEHRIGDFREFRLEHPDRMKAPDTTYPFPDA